MSTLKILIIRLSSIGDILLTTPLIRILKQNYPGCEIDYVIKDKFKELILYHPQINKIYNFKKNNLSEIRKNIRNAKYNIIIDIHKNFRSFYLKSNSQAQQVASYKKSVIKRWFLVKTGINLFKEIIPIYQRYLNVLNLKYDNKGLELFIPEKVNTKIELEIKKLKIVPNEIIIGVAPGASFKTKQWSKNGFSEVIQQLIHKYNLKVFLFGNEKDRAITSELTLSDNVFDFAGKYSIIESAAIMKHCSLILTNDTGLMHIATALNKKVIAVFGSTTEELGFFPYTTDFIVIQNEDLKCRPCSHVGLHKCPKEHFKCMEDIESAKIISAINSLLNLDRN